MRSISITVSALLLPGFLIISASAQDPIVHAEIEEPKSERQRMERELERTEQRLNSLKRPIVVTCFGLHWSYDQNTLEANRRFLNHHVHMTAEVLHVNEKDQTILLALFQSPEEQINPSPAIAAVHFNSHIPSRMERPEAFRRALLIGHGQVVVAVGICKGPET